VPRGLGVVLLTTWPQSPFLGQRENQDGSWLNCCSPPSGRSSRDRSPAVVGARSSSVAGVLSGPWPLGGAVINDDKDGGRAFAPGQTARRVHPPHLVEPLGGDRPVVRLRAMRVPQPRRGEELGLAHQAGVCRPHPLKVWSLRESRGGLDNPARRLSAPGPCAMWAALANRQQTPRTPHLGAGADVRGSETQADT
jgi:hypothetical protein